MGKFANTARLKVLLLEFGELRQKVASELKILRFAQDDLVLLLNVAQPSRTLLSHPEHSEASRLPQQP